MKKHCFFPVPFILIVPLFLLPILANCSVYPNTNVASQMDETTHLIEDINETSSLNSSPQKVEIKFSVELPISIQDQQIYLEVLDDLSGFSVNPQSFLMTKVDDKHFETRLSFIEGSLVKYRYSSSEVVEHTPSGEQVRFRMYYAITPGEVKDIVSCWGDNQFQGETGRIKGTVTDFSGNPLSDILITAGGLSTVSSANGIFLLEGISVGLHNLVATRITGDYLPFQQGAIVAAKATTPVQFSLRNPGLVNITFVLNQPTDYSDEVSVRFLGNLYAMQDNIYGVNEETSTFSSHAPLMTRLSDGRYYIILSLPTGFDLRYKYTLGNGIWNSELDSNGEANLRQIIVPSEDVVINDRVDKWYADGTQPLKFQVSVPENTPIEDKISIQFNTSAWLEPVIMQKTGLDKWEFILYNPLQKTSNMTYRYCRNDQCESAFASSINSTPAPFEINMSNPPVEVNDEITQWAWMNTETDPVTIVGTNVNPRGKDFIAGIELLEKFDPTYLPYYSDAFQNIDGIGANWVYLTPTWHYSSINPPVLEQFPGKDPFTKDVQEMIEQASNNNLQVALFPQTTKDDSDDLQWWNEADLSSVWWQSWFDQYRTFLLHFASIAQENSVKTLIISTPNILPALPNGKTSNTFSDSEARWAAIIDEIRLYYSGNLVLAVEDLDSINLTNEFLRKFDQIYLLMQISVSTNQNFDQDFELAVEYYLDNDVYSFWESIQKPIVIGIKYPSHPDAIFGCVMIENYCNPFDILDQPVLFTQEIQTDMNIQYKIYEKFLNAINERQWIAGIVSRGYYSPVELHDFSASVRGKPTAALLWYWFPRLISPIQ